MAVEINGDGLIRVDGTSTTQGRVRLAEDTDNGTNYVELTAPASLASNVVLTMPGTTGTVALTTDIPAAYAGPQAQTFTGNGTFTIPTGITRVKVTVVGGGGGGGAASSNNGSTGGTTSVASGTQTITTISATGGTGGTNATSNGSPGTGGTGSNGDLNIVGGDGTSSGSFTPVASVIITGGKGGNSILGGGGKGGTVFSGGQTAGDAGGAYGGGGGGAGQIACSGTSTSSGGGGGAGGAAIKWLTGLTPGNTLSVTVGGGGNGGAAGGAAGGAGAAGVVIFEY